MSDDDMRRIMETCNPERYVPRLRELQTKKKTIRGTTVDLRDVDRRARFCWTIVISLLIGLFALPLGIVMHRLSDEPLGIVITPAPDARLEQMSGDIAAGRTNVAWVLDGDRTAASVRRLSTGSNSGTTPVPGRPPKPEFANGQTEGK